MNNERKKEGVEGGSRNCTPLFLQTYIKLHRRRAGSIEIFKSLLSECRL
jgi:hypothetical protein